jgi:hypothetical protein
MAERIESFRDLIVYQKAFSLQQIIFETTKGFIRHDLQDNYDIIFFPPKAD